jgi:hypothetical protein
MTTLRLTSESRIKSNPHFASLLRQRLLARNGNGAIRETLEQLSDEELISVWLQNEQQGREYHAKRQARKAERDSPFNRIIKRAMNHG